VFKDLWGYMNFKHWAWAVFWIFWISLAAYGGYLYSLADRETNIAVGMISMLLSAPIGPLFMIGAGLIEKLVPMPSSTITYEVVIACALGIIQWVSLTWWSMCRR
jgi:hypothetical protein